MSFLAYIDAGTGSMLLQVTIAAIVSGMLFFGKIKGMLKSMFTRKHKVSPPSQDR